MKKFLIILLFIIVACLPFLSLLRPGYFPMHDDMQAMRVLQMQKCFQDWQIPCRWVPDMGYGYGYPQFNYYPPVPYYLMTVVSFTGISILDSVKIGLILTFVISGIGMFLLGRQFWGNFGGVLSSLFYLYLPYRAVNVYVRGAMGEIWAMAWFPWIVWSLEGWFRNRRNSYLLWLSLSLFGLATSHLLSAMMIAPFLVVWVVWRLWEFRDGSSRRTPGSMVGESQPLGNKIKTSKYFQPWIPMFIGMTKTYILPLIYFILLAVGLSAFYVLPAIFEKPDAHLETLLMGYFNYLAHYVSLPQLFLSTYWGYGSSIFGIRDGMPFSIGLLHWLIPLISVGIGGFIMLNLFKGPRGGSVSPELSSARQKYTALLIILGAAFGYLFLLHPRSTPIWLMIKPLEFLQFPWRFLAPVGFLFSLAAGSIISWSNTKNKLSVISYQLLIIVPLIFFNLSHFRPEKWFNITDADHFAQWDKLQTISIFDYLPIAAEHPPTAPAPDLPWFINGSGEILQYYKGSNWQSGVVDVYETGELRLPLFDFPGMQVKIDGQPVTFQSDNELGLITFDIPKGLHTISIKLSDTPIRTIGNVVTLTSIMLVGIYIISTNRKN